MNAEQQHAHEDNGMPRCILCGIAEEDQDWDFDEYRDENGTTYLCLMCLETH